jgi:hypothetical protein
LALTFAKIFGCTTDELFTLNGVSPANPAEQQTEEHQP